MANDYSVTGGAAVLNQAPAANEYGLVVRPIGGGSGPTKSGNSTLTSVPASIVPVLLLAANADRNGFSIRNTSTTDILYVKASAAGAPVSNTFHTVALVPGAYYEDPFVYTGDVYGVWSVATGDALVDEYTP